MNLRIYLPIETNEILNSQTHKAFSVSYLVFCKNYETSKKQNTKYKTHSQ